MTGAVASSSSTMTAPSSAVIRRARRLLLFDVGPEPAGNSACAADSEVRAWKACDYRSAGARRKSFPLLTDKACAKKFGNPRRRCVLSPGLVPVVQRRRVQGADGRLFAPWVDQVVKAWRISLVFAGISSPSSRSACLARCKPPDGLLNTDPACVQHPSASMNSPFRGSFVHREEFVPAKGAALAAKLFPVWRIKPF